MILGEKPESVAGTIERRKPKFYGHPTRKPVLANMMIEGRVEGSRGRGRPKRQCEDDLNQ